MTRREWVAFGCLAALVAVSAVCLVAYVAVAVFATALGWVSPPP